MANNFAGDSNCKALWKLDEVSGDRSDFISTNTLTDNNTVVAGATYKEGTGSADFTKANSEYLNRTDTNLSAGFPLKSGDTNKKISVSAWINADTITAPSGNVITVFSKYDSGTSANRSIAFGCYNNAGTLYAVIYQGHTSGTAFEVLPTHASALSLDTWYHVTWTYQDSDKSYAIRIRDTNSNTVGTDKTGNATNNIYVNASPCLVGGLFTSGAINTNSLWDGMLDEVVVFDDISTATEATQIAQGIYGIYTKTERGIRGLERGIYGGF